MNFEQKEEVFWMIQDFKKKVWSVTSIADELQINWLTTKKYTEQIPTKLDTFKEYIQIRIQEGTTNCRRPSASDSRNGLTWVISQTMQHPQTT